jgi:succinyl-CoA synthetase alpha subunit
VRALSAARAGVIVQGLTGRVARLHTRRMRDAGTRVAAGVTPGRGGDRVDGLPLFDTVAEAVEATGARAAVAFLPPPAAAEGLTEAVEAGIELAVSITEGVPPHPLMVALALARLRGTTVVGPNSAGLAVPGALSLGALPYQIARPGPVAVLSRSGTLSYEVVRCLSEAGVGQSIWLGVGGDPLKGLSFAEAVPALREDARTRALVLIGEIGGTDEEDAAGALRDARLPTVALLAGRTAPEGVQLGHAGAIVWGRGRGGYAGKAAHLREAGVALAARPSAVPGLLREIASDVM